MKKISIITLFVLAINSWQTFYATLLITNNAFEEVTLEIKHTAGFREFRNLEPDEDTPLTLNDARLETITSINFHSDEEVWNNIILFSDKELALEVEYANEQKIKAIVLPPNQEFPLENIKSIQFLKHRVFKPIPVRPLPVKPEFPIDQPK